MSNFSDWLKQVVKYEDEFLILSKTIVQKAALSLFARIKSYTPIGEPSLWKNPPPIGYVAGTLYKSWRIESNGYVRDDAGKFTSLDKGSLHLKLDKISIYNLQPYAERIEYGWSSQAPTGMVRRALLEYPTILNSVALTTRT